MKRALLLGLLCLAWTSSASAAAPTIDGGFCYPSANGLWWHDNDVGVLSYNVYRSSSTDYGSTWGTEAAVATPTTPAWYDPSPGLTAYRYRVSGFPVDGTKSVYWDCNAWAPPLAGGSVGAPLHTDAEAAAWVTATNEKASLTGNATANACDVLGTCLTQAKIDSYHSLKERANYQYVDGLAGFSAPSTDMLIQWASYKWGVPVDWVRAQMSHESDWDQQGAYGNGQNADQGDVCNLAVAQSCDDNAVHTDWFTLYPSQARVSSTCTSSDCRVGESMGIGQIKWRPSNTRGSGTEPLRWQSTAFNLDHYGATMRGWFDGLYNNSTPGDAWAAVCAWFTGIGNACNSSNGGTAYLSDVQARLAAKTWNSY
jgi:hypothetical protein